MARAHRGTGLGVGCAVWMSLLASASMLDPARLQAAEDGPSQRPIVVGATFGTRFFNEDLHVDPALSVGARVGVELGSRWTLLTDFLASRTHRKETSAVTQVDALRMLVRWDLARGPLRPYALAGVGGVLFLFDDVSDTAGGALTAGLGADYRIGRRTRLFLESSVDAYSEQSVTRDLAGLPVSYGAEQKAWLGSILIGLGFEL